MKITFKKRINKHTTDKEIHRIVNNKLIRLVSFKLNNTKKAGQLMVLVRFVVLSN